MTSYKLQMAYVKLSLVALTKSLARISVYLLDLVSKQLKIEIGLQYVHFVIYMTKLFTWCFVLSFVLFEPAFEKFDKKMTRKFLSAKKHNHGKGSAI